MKYTSKSALVLALSCAILAVVLLGGCASLSGAADKSDEVKASVSGDNGETLQPDETDSTTDIAKPEITATPASEPTSTSAKTATGDREYPIAVETGSTVSVDLDGNGSAEEVYYATDADNNGLEQILSVNGVDYITAAYDQGFSSSFPANDCYCITDIDTSDGLLEIAIMDYGPSDDYTTSFFRYDGNNVKYIGRVSDLAASTLPHAWLITFNGDGTVTSTIRLSVLQTWFASASWTVPESPGEFNVIPQTLYYCVPAYVMPVTTIAPVVAYADMDALSEKSVLPLGTVLTLTATDNESWVLAETEGGSKVWIHLGGDFGDVETENGCFSGQALEGLCMAD